MVGDSCRQLMRVRIPCAELKEPQILAFILPAGGQTEIGSTWTANTFYRHRNVAVNYLLLYTNAAISAQEVESLSS
jgi:hypothetical protein